MRYRPPPAQRLAAPESPEKVRAEIARVNAERSAALQHAERLARQRDFLLRVLARSGGTGGS